MESNTHIPSWRLPVPFLPLLADGTMPHLVPSSSPSEDLGEWFPGNKGSPRLWTGKLNRVQKSRAGSSPGPRSLVSLVAEPIVDSRCLAAEHRPSPLPLPASPHLHDLPGLHAQRGEVASPVNGNRLSQQRVQPLHLWPAQPALVPSQGSRGGLWVRAAAGRPNRGLYRGCIRPHLSSWPLQALNSTLRRHHSPGPGAPTAETRE